MDCFLFRAYIPFGCLPWRETAGHKSRAELVISPCKGNKYTAACCSGTLLSTCISCLQSSEEKTLVKDAQEHLDILVLSFAPFKMNENLKNTLKRSLPHLNLLCALSWIWRQTRVLFSRKLIGDMSTWQTSSLPDSFITDRRAAVVPWNQ